MTTPENFRHIVRIANTDLSGSKNIFLALSKVKGVGYMMSNAVLNVAGINYTQKAGTLTDAQINRINEIITNPAKFDIPTWMYNRRKDPETGEDKHLITSDLQFFKENDVKMMKKIKSYKGIRHSLGLPARGQRTKSNFRKSKVKNKGKSSIGVSKKKPTA